MQAGRDLCEKRFGSWLAFARRTQLHWPIKFLVNPKYRRQRKLAKRIIQESVNVPEWESVRSRIPHGRAGEGSEKYLWIQGCMEEAVSRIHSLGLDASGSLSVLDIGCGNGYFLVACRFFNHKVLGLDVGDEPLYEMLINLFKIPRKLHTVRKHLPLPSDLGSFDLITAFQICFNDLGQPTPWDFEAWRYFIEDCKTHLKPGGRIHLQLNPDKRSDYRYLSDDIARQIAALKGISVSADKAVIHYGDS